MRWWESGRLITMKGIPIFPAGDNHEFKWDGSKYVMVSRSFLVQAPSTKPAPVVTAPTQATQSAQDGKLDKLGLHFTGAGLSNVENSLIEKYGLKPVRGHIFRVAPRFHENGPDGPDSTTVIIELWNQIPPEQRVDQVHLYTAIGGQDGSTTPQALKKLLDSAVGKFFMVGSDFQIQADRDYPIEGRNEFSLFGRGHPYDNVFIPLNIEATSDEKIPPYRFAIIFGKITDFRLGKNRSGETIIVPAIRVIALTSPPFSTAEPSEIILNDVGVASVTIDKSDLKREAHRPTRLNDAESMDSGTNVQKGNSFPRPGIGGVGNPVCVYCPNPKYSDEARKAKYEGAMALQVVIAADGTVSDVQVVNGPGLGLNEAAIETVKQWKFKPAPGPDGKPVAVLVPVQITFRFPK
jgi:TonB family protein